MNLTSVDTDFLATFGKELIFNMGSIFALEAEEEKLMQIDNGDIYYAGMNYNFHTVASYIISRVIIKGDLFSVNVETKQFTFEVIRVEFSLNSWVNIFATCKDIKNV